MVAHACGSDIQREGKKMAVWYWPRENFMRPYLRRTNEGRYGLGTWLNY
jgi:hypothetical protein